MPIYSWLAIEIDRVKNSSRVCFLVKFAKLLVTYEGKPAHAGGAPWDGINALDAAVGAYVNVSMLRQQMKPDYRATGKTPLLSLATC